MATEISINPEPVQSFFSKLEARKALLSTIADIHKTLTSNFSAVDQALSLKSETLDARFTSLRQNTVNALKELQNREDGIPEREISMAARVEVLNAVAIAEIESPETTAGKLNDKSLSETLRFYCRRMDASGLMKFLFQNRKDSAALRTEIPDAVEESVDAMRLVLDAAEDYVGMKVAGKSGMADRRRACGMLIQSVVPIKEGGVVVARTLKERAAGVLAKWKGVLGGGSRSNEASMFVRGGIRPNEASMFLQLIVGFGLRQEFEENFLRKLIVQFASRRDMPKLSVALGFGNKITGIIDQLVKSGKEIEAVYFASEAGLTERYPPVSLLKTSLRNCKRNAKDASRKGNFSAASVERANHLELDATKAIMQCVEDLKLEAQFPLEGLKKRVEQLENAKSGKRKSTGSANRPSKKRGIGGGGGDGGRGTPSSRPPKAARFSSGSGSVYPRNPPRTHMAPPPSRYSGPYGYPNHQPIYEGHGAPNHQPIYEGHGAPSYAPLYNEPRPQSPAAYPQQYGYPTPDVRGATHYAAGAQQPQGGTYGESPVALPQQYVYPTPPDVATGTLRSGPHYAAQAQVNYGGSPAAPPAQQYSYSPQDASRARGVTSHEAAPPGSYGAPGDYTAYDYAAAATANATATAYPSSYQAQ